MDGIGTVTECLMRVIDIARRASATSSPRGGDVLWDDSSRTALRGGLPPIYAATGMLRIPDIIRFISTAPMSVQQVYIRDNFRFGDRLAIVTIPRKEPERNTLQANERERREIEPRARQRIATAEEIVSDGFQA